MKEINVDVFEEEVIKSEIPVVVDFWAPWCGPCKMLGPVLEDVSKEFDGKAKFVKVNVDNNPQLAVQFEVSSIPTVIIFKGGEAAEEMVGFKPKNNIVELLQKHI